MGLPGFWLVQFKWSKNFRISLNQYFMTFYFSFYDQLCFMFFPFLPFKVGASVKIEKKKKRPEELVEMSF